MKKCLQFHHAASGHISLPFPQYPASLLKLDDPAVEIGRLKEPLLTPNKDEREGYVPNVLYSCGALVHNGDLIIPYGLSDYASGFATVPLKKLLNKILHEN